jgi:hypothetical protein
MSGPQSEDDALDGFQFQAGVCQTLVQGCREIVEVRPRGAETAPGDRNKARLAGGFPAAPDPSRQENHHSRAGGEGEIFHVKFRAAPPNQNQSRLAWNALLLAKGKASNLKIRPRDNQPGDQQLIQNLQGIRPDRGSHFQSWNLEGGSGLNHNL